MGKINQRASYNRTGPWSPVPCEKHGPRGSEDKTEAKGLNKNTEILAAHTIVS